MVFTRFHPLLAVVYIASLLLIGFLAGRKRKDSNQFLNATGALPLWVCITASIAANCGSLDVIAMTALGAQYGILACHFYWIGAIPALVVLVFWLLPAYAKERYPSVLDFINQRYGSETRSAVALGMATMMLLLAGVCLCAAAQVLTTFLGWKFAEGVLLVATVVMIYTWVGGLRATVYTELLHFVVVLAAILPLGYFVVRDFGGIHGILANIPHDKMHAWQSLPWVAPNAIMDRFGLVLGLGLVLSFGYWSTDFVVMQRALAVRRAEDVQYVPLALAAAKLLFAMLIVIPGVIAPVVLKMGPATNWNATLPSLMLHYYNPFWVVVGVIGLAASLVATFANNVSGFSAVWIQGVYKPLINTDASESHYLWMSRIGNAAAVVLSVGGAYVALEYHSLMEYMQMIFAAFNGPLLALVALAALAPRRAAGGGLAGFTLGLLSAILHQILVHAGVLHYGSPMSANFYAATLSLSVATICTLVAARLAEQKTQNQVLHSEPVPLSVQFSLPLGLMALGVLLICVTFNAIFR
jgi:SSS family solute:Na+ symporter